MRVAQIWQWLYHRGARDFAAMTNLARPYRETLAARFRIARPEIVTRQVSADGTRKYLLRIAGGHEIETVYIPEADRGTLCVSSPGRLHAHLHLLPHRHPAAGAQPDRRRDRRPGHGRPRRPRRLGPQARREAAGLQPRADGHGRAALQLRGGARRDEDRHGRRGHRALPPPDHPLDLGRRARDRPGRRRDRLPARHLVPRHHRRGARRAGADQPQVDDRRRCSTPAAPTRGSRTPSGSPSST